MPRATPQRRVAPPPAPPPEPNSLIASAASVTRDGVRPRTTGNRAWQNEAWTFYDTVGELRAAANWLGNAMSRVSLGAFRSTPDGDEALTSGLAADAVAGLFNGDTGQSQMLATLSVNLTVPGEGYVVAEPTRRGQPDQWWVCSAEEIRSSAGVWTIERDGKRELSNNALIMRVWRSHPRRWVEADSSVRAALPILRELIQLTKHVAASVDSRLAGAGVFIVPSEMTFATPTPGVDPQNPLDDPFLAQLATAMLTPIEDRASAAAVVPILLKAPGSVIGDVKHITFSTPLDEQALSLREEALKRLALATDLPPEIMLGQGQSNHWSAWQIDEAALKIYIEPLLELICDAFTRKWLWPILEVNGQPDYDVLIKGDTSDLRVRPNHAAEAIQLYDRGELSPDALRRETGFSESDAPSDDELAQIIRIKLASANNDLTAAAANALGVGLTPADIGNTRQPVPPPQVETPVGRDRTLPERQAASAVLAATELLVLRALERANNRISRRGHQRRQCDESECNVALAGAWTNVGRVAEPCGLDAQWLTAQLDAYVRHLLISGEDHDPERLAEILFPRLALVDA